MDGLSMTAILRIDDATHPAFTTSLPTPMIPSTTTAPPLADLITRHRKLTNRSLHTHSPRIHITVQTPCIAARVAWVPISTPLAISISHRGTIPALTNINVRRATRAARNHYVDSLESACVLVCVPARLAVWSVAVEAGAGDVYGRLTGPATAGGAGVFGADGAGVLAGLMGRC